MVYTANLPPSLIGMEAGVGSHLLGRGLREQGHEVRLIPVQFTESRRKFGKLGAAQRKKWAVQPPPKSEQPIDSRFAVT